MTVVTKAVRQNCSNPYQQAIKMLSVSASDIQTAAVGEQRECLLTERLLLWCMSRKTAASSLLRGKRNCRELGEDW